MFVIMDTNILLKDVSLVSNSFGELKSHSEKLGIKLFVSSIVLDEIVQKFKEKVVEFNQKAKGFIGIIPDRYLQLVPDESLDEMAEEFRKELIKKFRINSFGTRFVEWDFLDQESNLAVYEKAIRKLKPFLDSGKGYKDALIWEQIMWVVKTYCTDNRKLAFITENLTDFSDKTKGEGEWYLPALHLIEQYQREGFSEDTVRIYPSLKAFNLDVIYKKLNVITPYVKRLNTELNEQLKAFIQVQLNSNTFETSIGKVNVYSIKMVEALDAYNEYGNTNAEAVFKILFEMIGVTEGNNNRTSIYTGIAYITIDMNSNKFLEIEADIL